MSKPDPYLIEGPALISFSGGRTSAYMLYRVIKAHGGQLPDNIIVAFANTGKEREETLRFVHECEVRWGVRIHWIEWRDGKPGYETVGFNSASREGEPFEALITKKKRLPNGQERWCTEFLKVRPIFALMRDLLGLEPGQYREAIGLRHDEGWRILKSLSAARFKIDRKTKLEVPRVPPRLVVHPLAASTEQRVKGDIYDFWWGMGMQRHHQQRPRGFDLELDPHEGNCDLCFQKGKGIRKRIIRDMPSSANWWIAREQQANGTFDKRASVAELAAQVRNSPTFFDEDAGEADIDHDVECGLLCAWEDAA